MRESVRLVALALVLTAGGCANPVKQSHAALNEGRPLDAFRISRAALPHAKPGSDDEKHLRNALIISARQILATPDPGDPAESLELIDGLPEGSEESERAAQRLLRVLARGSTPEKLDDAFKKLEPGMGDETAVRSNLRAIVDANLGRPSSVWAANVVVTRWPDHYERWMDLARAQASVGAHDAAKEALVRTEERLSAFCRELPARMASYDAVRRKSAYGEFELKRCEFFPEIARAYAASMSGKASAPSMGTGILETHAATTAACPPAEGAAPAGGEGVTSALMVSPRPPAWWLDGAPVKELVAPAGGGPHVVTWREGGTCRSVKIELVANTALVVRTEIPRAP